MGSYVGKYIEFIEVEQKPKTKVYAVVTVYDVEETIGYIKWFPRWRKYAFYPNLDTVWETKCLTDIIEFLNKLMEDRKK